MFCAEEKMWLISVFYCPCFSFHKECTEASWLECSADCKLTRRKEKLFGTPLAVARAASGWCAEELALQSCCLRW